MKWKKFTKQPENQTYPKKKKLILTSEEEQISEWSDAGNYPGIHNSKIVSTMTEKKTKTKRQNRNESSNKIPLDELLNPIKEETTTTELKYPLTYEKSEIF